MSVLKNLKWEKFAQEYAKNPNAKQAYRKAGYRCADSSAETNANRLLRKDQVKARVRELSEKAESDAILSITQIKEYLSGVVTGSDLDEQLTTDEMGEIKRTPVRRQTNQIKAAELLAKMQGGFDTSTHVSVTVPVFVGEGDLADD